MALLAWEGRRVISWEISDGEMARVADQFIRKVLTELTEAVKEETLGFEKDMEQITRLAVKGKLWRAWKSQMHWKGAMAREPAGSVFVNGSHRSNGAINFFTKEGRIVSGGGKYLVIPTEAAGRISGNAGRYKKSRQMTPDDWETATGRKLRFVYRKGRPALWVLDEAKIVRGRAKVRSGRRQGPGYGATVVIFIGLKFVNFSPRFSMEPLHQRRGRMLAENVERRMNKFASVNSSVNAKGRINV